ncbi:uncharacterized protein PITG_10648 [Phytophthora infestans T30-4]|uniref:BTB domain-containing protein n=2 Tax=Phytophthora infestans TaxID=4787 RepID=D0NGR9_PHYIT|nr:uncharacterized protein PITG_10648 [Phytophthora infestans T30-4]EEY58558.1 conserved hypothetical protein [Phytophthora infestans T30-4]KAF4037364.1 Kelch motif [Phytophthora infestans]KAF4127569.1 Kelch motif [Phytophthora infestans]|eukprot:XP_002901502.1 conserved hypothetical protein [Phytophthora infestans T30-4]
MASHMKNSAAQLPAMLSQLSSVHSDAGDQQEQRHKLFAMCQRQELTDVVLLLQPEPLQSQDEAMSDVQEVAAHRVILATASPFFHALFTSGMKESHEISPRVPLPGVPFAAFQEILRYVYMGELRVSGDTILSVLHAANRLELEEVVEICCKQLMLEINVNNCVEIYMSCEQLQMRAACRLLAQAARAMIDTYFCDVYRSESFKNLSLHAVMKILRPKERNNSTAVKSWMMRHPIAKQRQLSEVLQLPTNTEDETAPKRRNSGNAMVNSKERRPSVSTDDAMDVYTANVLSREIEENAKRQLTPTVFVIGGFNSPGALNSVEYLDFHRREWHPAASMATRRSYGGVAVSSDHKIFVMGGTSSSSHHHKTMEVYDPEANTWTSMPAMKNARSYLGATMVGDFIYAVGGFNGQTHLSSVERFDIQTQHWESMPSLSTGRSGLAVAALNGLVYAIGGYDGRKHLKSVEVFDPQTNEWSTIASMRYARNGPAAVVQERCNSILVYGGESRHGSRMNTSDRLDLDSGVWSDADAFADCRSGHVASSFLNESFVFCLGGSNKKDEYLDAVHRFDNLSKQWTLHSQMRAQRCGLSVAVVKTSRYAECFAVQKQREQQLDSTSSSLWRKSCEGNTFAQGA